VCVVKKGRIAACIVRERYSRTKHAISLEFRNILDAVAAARLRLDQIDYCSITSTQEIELIIDDPAQFSINFAAHPKHVAPCTFQKILEQQNIDPQTMLSDSLMEILYDPAMRQTHLYQYYSRSFPEYRGRKDDAFAPFGWMDRYVGSKLWPGATLEQIAKTDFSQMIADDSTRHGFHYPVTVKLADATWRVISSRTMRPMPRRLIINLDSATPPSLRTTDLSMVREISAACFTSAWKGGFSR